ncbi:MAG: ABC transporter substrate-binding protein, partial [Rhodospirillales bacterium]|nr:ABC transporter substrate-binding protein [Rhodospirillales bacterium]
DYHELDTLDLHKQVINETDDKSSTADLTLSSAMDLQIQLVNDGYSAPYFSEETEALPGWANWRNEAFGFTYEPAVIIFNQALAPDLKQVGSRFELAKILSEQSAKMRNRVVTYDPEHSGLGYLFGTQDAVQSEDFWYLARSMGDSAVQLMTSSASMINKVASGDALIAYNVLGSYALARARENPDLAITIPQDYGLVMSRIAVITRTAKNPKAAGQFVDFLLSQEGQELIAGPASLYAIRTDISGEATAKKLQETAKGPLIPIHLGPGLLVYLDRMKRKDFLKRWQRAMQGK